MFSKEYRLVFKRESKEVLNANSAATNRAQEIVDSAKAQRRELTKELPEGGINAKFEIDHRLDPKRIIANLSNEDKDYMEELDEGKVFELKDAQLVPFASAILKTRLASGNAEMRPKLTSYVEAASAGKPLSDEQQETQDWLVKNYRGLSRFYSRYENLADGSRGGVEGFVEKAKESGIEGIKDVMDFFNDRSPVEKIAIVIAMITGGIWLAKGTTNPDGTPSNAAKIRNILFPVITGGGLLYGANLISENVGDKESLAREVDKLNSTADYEGFTSYLNIQGEGKEDATDALIEGVYDPKIRGMRFKDLRAAHNGASSKKELTLSPDRVDPKNLYYGLDAFFKKLDRLKTDEPKAYAQISKMIDKGGSDGKGAEFIDVFVAMLELDPSAWHISEYNTIVAGKIFNWLEDGDHINGDFEDYLDDNMAGFDAWLKQSKFNPNLKTSAGKRITTEEWLTTKFGARFDSRADLGDTHYSNRINEALASNKKLNIDGNNYMAVSVKIKADDTVLDYIKRAHAELHSKYGLGDAGNGLEPLLGAVIEKPGNEYVLLVREADPARYNPIA